MRKAILAQLFVIAVIGNGGSLVAREIVIKPGLGGIPSCEGMLISTPVCEGPACPSPIEILPKVGQYSLEMREQMRWQMRLQSSNCWSAPAVLDDAGTAAEVVVWPLRRVKAVLAVPSGASAPSVLRARVTSATAAIDATVECEPIGEAWTCSAPAIPLDLRFDADGFTPVYLWDVAADDMKTKELSLQRGASIIGWVESAGGPVADARVEISFPKRQVITNKRGFFQIVGVQPGIGQTITVRKEGLSSETLRDVIADEGREHSLRDAIHLERLASLQISIMPPVDPKGQPWAVRLSRALPGAATLSTVASEQATLAGFWSRDDLESGEYSITIADHRGSVFEQRRVSVVPGIPLLPFQLTRVAVRGTVHAGDDPLEARLSFMRAGRRVRMQSDEKGVFNGVLPEEGSWEIEITPRSAFSVVKRRVDVVRRGEESEARIEIELPGGRIEGEVVDEDGKPVRAIVNVRRDRTVAYAETDAAGSFTVVGLEPSSVSVEAVARNGASATVSHDVTTEKQTSPLRIVIGSQEQIEARIVTSTGAPIPGAIIREIIPPWQRRVETESGPDGRFTLSRTKSAPMIDVIIFAAGFPVKITSVSVSASSPVTIELGRASARLKVQVRRAPPWPLIRTPSGSFLSLSSLMLKLSPFGPPQGMVPGGYEGEIEPGTYAVCADASSTSKCEVVTLQPGGQAVVDARDWSEPVEGPPQKEGSSS